MSASTGIPIAGAHVTASGATTTTTTDGSFRLGGLKKDEMTGTVTSQGYPDTMFRIPGGEEPTPFTVELEDSVLRLELSENAVEPKPIRGYKLRLDGADVTATASIGPLTPGVHTLQIAATGCESLETSLALKPGVNNSSVKLSLTALETYKRFYNAGKFHRDSVSYKYIHPDERKVLSLKEWIKWGSGDEDLSIKFGETRMLGKWTCKPLKKTYARVAEIDRTTRYQVTDPKYSDFGKTYTDNFSQHWAKSSGRWYILHAKLP